MVWFLIGGAVVATAVVAALSDDDSSSSSRSRSYSTTTKKTISEDEVKTKKDYINEVIDETKKMLFEKYGAKVEIDQNGDYEVLFYGDEFNKLEAREKELIKELNKLENIEI